MKIGKKWNSSYSSDSDSVEYRKISTVSPGLIFVQKAALLGLFSGGGGGGVSYFRRGLLLGGILHFKIVWA